VGVVAVGWGRGDVRQSQQADPRQGRHAWGWRGRWTAVVGGGNIDGGSGSSGQWVKEAAARARWRTRVEEFGSSGSWGQVSVGVIGLLLGLLTGPSSLSLQY